MKARELEDENLKLVAPDIERDPPIAVGWINSKEGHKTLESMGNVPSKIKETTLKAEQDRVNNFIENNDQLNWMIEVDEKIVGTVWVSLVDVDTVKAPSVHIMIGELSSRGQGIGNRALDLAIQQLATLGRKQIYSRHLVSNKAIAKTFEKLWFGKDGEPYTDKDGLVWQNVILELE